MKRGGEGEGYIRKTVDKSAVMVVLKDLERKAQYYINLAKEHSLNPCLVSSHSDKCTARASALRYAVDALERELNLLEGHPTRGWW